MTLDIKTVQVFEVDGSIKKVSPSVKQVSAFELEGKIYKTKEAAVRASTLVKLNSLLGSNDSIFRGAPHKLLDNAQAVVDTLQEYLDELEK